jgi:hypothetical protein
MTRLASVCIPKRDLIILSFEVMTELERAVRSNPLFRNRFCAATTIHEALAISKRYRITTCGIEILDVRAQLMPELVEAESLSLALKCEVKLKEMT